MIAHTLAAVTGMPLSVTVHVDTHVYRRLHTGERGGERKPTVVYVKNLPYTASKRVVAEFFGEIDITDIRIPTDDHGRSKVPARLATSKPVPIAASS